MGHQSNTSHHSTTKSQQAVWNACGHGCKDWGFSFHLEESLEFLDVSLRIQAGGSEKPAGGSPEWPFYNSPGYFLPEDKKALFFWSLGPSMVESWLEIRRDE